MRIPLLMKNKKVFSKKSLKNKKNKTLKQLSLNKSVNPNPNLNLSLFLRRTFSSKLKIQISEDMIQSNLPPKNRIIRFITNNKLLLSIQLKKMTVYASKVMIKSIFPKSNSNKTNLWKKKKNLNSLSISIKRNNYKNNKVCLFSITTIIVIITTITTLIMIIIIIIPLITM